MSWEISRQCQCKALLRAEMLWKLILCEPLVLRYIPIRAVSSPGIPTPPES